MTVYWLSPFKDGIERTCPTESYWALAILLIFKLYIFSHFFFVTIKLLAIKRRVSPRCTVYKNNGLLSTEVVLITVVFGIIFGTCKISWLFFGGAIAVVL